MTPDVVRVKGQVPEDHDPLEHLQVSTIFGFDNLVNKRFDSILGKVKYMPSF
jgi:hypothetical protein